jgi:threonine/homoserine/homoserine lactone efflux protein
MACEYLSMPDPTALGVFSLASLALLVVPGPSVLYIVTRGITQGRKAGLASVLGVHVGTTFHIAAATLGLSALLMRSIVAFNIVKYAGAAYLVYLGIRRLLDDDSPVQTDWVQARSLARIFRQGIVVNVLNPKTALFFLAFLPQFVDVEKGSVPLQMLVLGSIFIVLGLISDGTYALVSSLIGSRLRTSKGFARRERLLSGGVYLGLGVTAALSGHRSSSA